MSDIMLNAGQAAGTPLVIDMGGDMSASRSSRRIYLGGAKTAAVTITWPATPQGGTNPTGAWAIKATSKESTSAADFATLQGCLSSAFVDAQPAGAGTAGQIIADNIGTTCPYLLITYTASSGGTGVTPTVYVFAK